MLGLYNLVVLTERLIDSCKLPVRIIAYEWSFNNMIFGNLSASPSVLYTLGHGRFHSRGRHRQRELLIPRATKRSVPVLEGRTHPGCHHTGSQRGELIVPLILPGKCNIRPRPRRRTVYACIYYWLWEKSTGHLAAVKRPPHWSREAATWKLGALGGRARQYLYALRLTRRSSHMRACLRSFARARSTAPTSE